MPILTSMQLGQGLTEGAHRAVFVEFEGSGTPARAAFKIAWTELFHVDRNSAGLLTSRLTELEVFPISNFFITTILKNFYSLLLIII